jgi:hypothetical protein
MELTNGTLIFQSVDISREKINIRHSSKSAIFPSERIKKKTPVNNYIDLQQLWKAINHPPEETKVSHNEPNLSSALSDYYSDGHRSLLTNKYTKAIIDYKLQSHANSPPKNKFYSGFIIFWNVMLVM